jgi:glucokinase
VSAIRRAIGVDIGGTKTAVSAVEDSGRVHARAEFATRSERGFDVGLAEIEAAIRSVADQAGWTMSSIAGIGIGCAGPVNPQRGTIHNPFTLPGWNGADIVTPLREKFQVPVRLENDADAAAFGEFQFGAGRGRSPLVMIAIGTGIGGAALIDGEVFRGVNDEHPELGHVPVQPDGPECYCGARGCWESLASGSAIAAAGKPLGLPDTRSVFAAAARDVRAQAIVQRAVDATARAAWVLLHTFLPELIILGGGIGTAHFERFAAPMREQVSRATQIPKGSIELVRASLDTNAGVVGAACLGFHIGNRT